MIILKIRFIPKPEMSLAEGANFLHDNFPQDDTLVSVGTIDGPARDDDHLICLKLKQDRLTDFQRDYLHLSTFAVAHIDDFEVDTNPIDTETKPTIDAGNLREQVYIAKEYIQRAIDALEPIHHDSTLKQVMIDLETAMEAILDIREML